MLSLVLDARYEIPYFLKEEEEDRAVIWRDGALKKSRSNARQ